MADLPVSHGGADRRPRPNPSPAAARQRRPTKTLWLVAAAMAEGGKTFFCRPLGRRRLENRCFATRCHGGDQKTLVLPPAMAAVTILTLFCQPLF